jgi:hypothetical protein
MSFLVAVGQFLRDLAIYLVNGLLEIVYQVTGHWAMLISLLCGLAVLLVFDRVIQRIEVAAPSRQGQRPSTRPSRRHQAVTGIALGLWLLVSAFFPTPVPQLGAAMWVLFVLALLVMPTEQYNTLWRSKMAILTYCAVLVAFRIVAAWTLAADPREWAAIVGTVGEAQRVVAGGRSIVLSIASYASWFGVPGAYVMYVFQKMSANSLVNPLARAGEVAWLIRQRPD